MNGGRIALNLEWNVSLPVPLEANYRQQLEAGETRQHIYVNFLLVVCNPHVDGCEVCHLHVHPLDHLPSLLASLNEVDRATYPLSEDIWTEIGPFCLQ